MDLSNQTIDSLINHHNSNNPDKIFMIDAGSGQSISYQKLKYDIELMGCLLKQSTLKSGDKVAFLLDNSYATVSLLLSTMYHGFVVVPINAVSGAKTIAYVLEHCDCNLLFISTKYQTQFAQLLSQDKNSKQFDIVPYDDLPSNQTVQSTQVTTISKPNKNTPALLIYTSGTTGLPKGVLLSHQNIIAGGHNTATAHQITPKHRALCVLPLYHINAIIVTIMCPLVSNSSVVIAEKFSASNFWQLIAKFRCTWFSVVPTIISYLLNDAKQNPNATKQLDLDCLVFGRSASAPLPAHIHQQFGAHFKIKLIETMGITETSAQILSNPLDIQKQGSAGIAYGNSAIIIDDNDGSILGFDVQGELAIKGDNVMQAYYNNEQATQKSFNNDGYFLTGDLAKQDKDGFFYITGRKKELIIKGGENISPREIDDVLYQHNAILEACAFAMPDDNYGETIAVCIHLKLKQTLTKIAVKEFCNSILGDFKTPSYVFFTDDLLPKGPSGKIQRLALAKQYTKQ